MIKEEANKVTDFIAKSAAALEAKDATIAQQAKTIEEVQAIYVDFDNMPMPTVEETTGETTEEPGK